MKNDIELSLSSIEDIFKNDDLELKRRLLIPTITDLAILTGASFDDKFKMERGLVYTKSVDEYGRPISIDKTGAPTLEKYGCTIRPTLSSPFIYSNVVSNKVLSEKGLGMVSLGEYPQYLPDYYTQSVLLEEKKKGNLRQLNESYSLNDEDLDFNIYNVYEYNNRKYICIKPFFPITLWSNEFYTEIDNLFVEVSPVIWLVDDLNKTLISMHGLLRGHLYDLDKEKDFNNTKLYGFLNYVMLKDILQNTEYTLNEETLSQNKLTLKR